MSTTPERGSQEPAEGSRETVEADLARQQQRRAVNQMRHDDSGEGVSDYVPDA